MLVESGEGAVGASVWCDIRDRSRVRCSFLRLISSTRIALSTICTEVALDRMEGSSRIVSIVATKPHEAVVFLLHFLADVRNVCVHVCKDALDDDLLATLDSRGTACYKQIAPRRDGGETLSQMAGESECVLLFEDGMTSESLSTLRRASSRVITGRSDDVHCAPRDVAAEMLRQWADSDARVQAVYDYWFRARDETGAPVFNGKMWLKQASALDEEIREKFSSLHEAATSGACWASCRSRTSKLH